MGDRGRAVGVFPGIRYRYQISETKRGTSESPRHTWLTRYRCSLPGLAGFAGPRCTEPEVPRSSSRETAEKSLAQGRWATNSVKGLSRGGNRSGIPRYARDDVFLIVGTSGTAGRLRRRILQGGCTSTKR